MPYEITDSGCPEGKPFAVRKQGGGKVMGCHTSRESAKRQLAALYANEKSHLKTAIKREHGMDFPPRDYAYVPDPMRPSTWKLRLTEAPGKVSEIQLRRAAAALSPAGFRGNRVDLPTAALASVKRRVRAEFRRLKVDESKIPTSVKGLDEDAFFVWKDATTGLLRWFAIYSNNFQDNDNPPETISEQSQLNFVELVDEGVVDYPELWLWHIKGTAWGKADWVDYVHGFAMATGLVYKGFEYIARNLMKMKDIKVSHGMPKPLVVYDPADPSTIVFHVSHEISPLPGWAAANKLTTFVVLDEGSDDMALRKEKKDFLAEVLGANGPEKVAQLEANLEKARAEATDSGLISKEADTDDGEIDDFNTGELDVPDGESEDEDEVEVEAESEPVAAKEATSTKAKMTKPEAMMDEEEMPKKKKMPKKKEASPEAPNFATRQEIVDVLAPLMQQVADLTANVESLTKEIKQLKAADDEKISHIKEVTPTLSLAQLISQNAIGKSKTHVKEGDTLARQSPAEASDDTVPAATPVPFINEMIGYAAKLRTA